MSRSASPMRLKASASARIAAPGKKTSQGAAWKYVWFSKMMLPQDAVGGCTPMPR
jgi:hypothetical protein